MCKHITFNRLEIDVNRGKVLSISTRVAILNAGNAYGAGWRYTGATCTRRGLMS